MRIAGETIGARGAALLAVTAVVGVLLANHGWSSRNNGVPPTGAAIGGPAPSASAPSTPTASAPPGPRQGPTPGPTAGPSKAPSRAPTPGPTPGPKLSSQSYASYAFQVWPGPLSAAAKSAEIGLVISVRKQGTGISVSAGVAGQPAPTARYYPTGTRVYVIEASLGDDSGNSDYNLGDDGLVVTDSQGRILQ
jgi:hypothetical protein